MAYGSATVRPYVGAVKGVALPIVSQAINRGDARYFHSPLQTPGSPAVRLLGEMS